jgi:hypothetical protein
MYRYYGGKGVSVCDRWNEFVNFLADMGEPPSGASLDRIDSSGDYDPSNCRWATAVEQNTNRSTTVFITYRNERLSVSAFARKIGVQVNTVRRRLNKQGMSPEEIASTPIRKRKDNARTFE